MSVRKIQPQWGYTHVNFKLQTVDDNLFNYSSSSAAR